MATENTDIGKIPGTDTLPETDETTASELDRMLLEATEGKGEEILLTLLLKTRKTTRLPRTRSPPNRMNSTRWSFRLIPSPRLVKLFLR